MKKSPSLPIQIFFGILAITPLLSFGVLVVLAIQMDLIDSSQLALDSGDFAAYRDILQEHPLGGVYTAFSYVFITSLVLSLVVFVADLISNKEVSTLGKVIWTLSIILLPFSFPVYWLINLRHSKVWS